MGLFTLGIISGPGFGGLIMGFVEANQRLQWRWVHWIELSECHLGSVRCDVADTAPQSQWGFSRR